MEANINIARSEYSFFTSVINSSDIITGVFVIAEIYFKAVFSLFDRVGQESISLFYKYFISSLVTFSLSYSKLFISIQNGHATSIEICILMSFKSLLGTSLSS